METALHISAEEYLTREAHSTFKSEYHAGEIRAMAGAQEEHNALVANLIYLLQACLWKTDCRVYPGDLLIALPECERFVYADVSVVCGKPQISRKSRNGLDVLANPRLVIEVLSDTTESYDRGEKFTCYRQLDSLQQYVLADSRKMAVETFTRMTTEKDRWVLQTFTKPDELVHVGDCLLLLSDLYHKTGIGESN